MYDQELIDSEVKSLIDELKQTWPSSDVPSELYHYTDAKGLLGILTSKTLWATDINFLNDSMELKYGSDLVNEVLKDLERPSTTGLFIRRYPITIVTFGPTLHPELTQRSLNALLGSTLGYTTAYRCSVPVLRSEQMEFSGPRPDLS